jgi:CHAT domain-containing protein/tetratricopeptide (TPR) repeat protein
MPAMVASALALALTLLVVPQQPADPVGAARAAVAAAEQQHGVDSLETADALVKLFQQLSPPTDFDEMLAAATRTVAIREAKLPGHPRLGVAWSNLASLHVQRHDLDQAIPLFERACDLLSRTPPSRARMAAMGNLGVCQVQRGDYAKAEPLLQGAVDYGRQHASDHPLFAQTLQNLAQLRLNLGQVEAARALVDATVELLAKTVAGTVRHGHALYGLGYTLLAAQRQQEAEALFRQALEVLRPLGAAVRAHEAQAEAGLGWALRQRGDLAAAIVHTERALQCLGDTEPSTGRQWQLQLARLFLLTEQPERALAVATQALPATARPEAHGHRAFVTLGEVLAANGRHEAAIEVLRDAIAAAGTVGIEWTGSLHTARHRLARSLHATGDLATALAEVRRNLAGFEVLLGRTLPALADAERLALVATHRADLDAMLAWSAERPDLCDPAAAYGHLLGWKGQVARGVLLQQDAARLDPVAGPRLRRLQAIASLATLGRLDEATRRERERLQAQVDAVPVAPVAVAVAAVQAALAPDAVLVDFVHTRTLAGAARFLAFVVSRDAVRRVALGPAEPIAAAIDAHVLLTSRSSRAGSAAVASPAAKALHDLVLMPLGVAGTGRLWLSPDDVVAMVPFATLPGTKDGSYLVEEREVAYVQNALDLTRAPVARTGQLLAFGAIDYGGASAAIAMRGVPRPFAPLAHTEQELAALAAVHDGSRAVVVRGADASEARLRELVVGAELVHLATHGFCGTAAGDDVVSAGIALAGANAAPTGDDGILTVDEARWLDLSSCRIVVLSACQTGLGKPFAGESLLGLRRSLRIAGARATVTSLWRVEDAATAALMADFHRGIARGDADAATALCAAQRQALARARAQGGEGLPATWGAFVSEGTR